jgi:hypothetical protein
MAKIIKPVILILIIVIALSGTVAAASDLNVQANYIDPDNNVLETAEVGDQVEYLAEVENTGDETANDVTLGVDFKESTIDWQEEGAFLSKDDGETWDEITPTPTDTGLEVDMGSIVPDQIALFNVHLIPQSAGTETTLATVYKGNTAVDSSEATIKVVNPANPAPQASAKTVPMQTTGAPIGLLGLAFALVSAGLVYSRKK